MRKANSENELRDTTIGLSFCEIEEFVLSFNFELLDHFKRSFLNKTTETIGEMYAKSYIKDLIETSYIIKNETDNKYLLTNKINDENSIF